MVDHGPVPLLLPYKGARDYLTGADMTNAVAGALAERAGSVQRLDIAFRTLARERLDLYLTPPPAKAAVTGSGCFTTAGGQSRFWLLPSGQAVTARMPYDEEGLVNATRFDVGEGTAAWEADAPHDSGATFIELWVAMIKALHQRSFPTMAGRWLFVRAVLDGYRPRPACGLLGARIVAGAGGRFTRIAVSADGIARGDVYFALQ